MQLVNRLTLILLGLLITGCVSTPSPGSNADYRRLQRGDIPVKPSKKPSYISLEALNRIRAKTSAAKETNK